MIQAKSVYRQIVIPMAMPLLVGPGVIANVILYASEAAERHKGGLRLELILVTGVVCTLVFLVLASGSRLQRLLGDIGLSITQRVMGLFVAAIASGHDEECAGWGRPRTMATATNSTGRRSRRGRGKAVLTLNFVSRSVSTTGTFTPNGEKSQPSRQSATPSQTRKRSDRCLRGDVMPLLLCLP